MKSMNFALCCSRDGTVFGCGSTKHGQLPYLKFASPSEDGEDALDEHQKATDEITQATRLKLPILQVDTSCDSEEMLCRPS